MYLSVWFGVNMMYFLSGLQSIPEEYYEAASVDGATTWQRFIHITFGTNKDDLKKLLTLPFAILELTKQASAIGIGINKIKVNIIYLKLLKRYFFASFTWTKA